MTRTIFLLALMAVSTAFAAGVQGYKWTDAQGVVHYSDAPPPTTQTNVQTVRVTGGDRPHDVAMAAPTGSTEEQQPAAQNPAAPNTPPAAPVDHSKDCATARSNLELLQSKFQVTVNGPDGKPVPLDDKARQVQLAAANAQVAFYCMYAGIFLACRKWGRVVRRGRRGRRRRMVVRRAGHDAGHRQTATAGFRAFQSDAIPLERRQRRPAHHGRAAARSAIRNAALRSEHECRADGGSTEGHDSLNAHGHAAVPVAHVTVERCGIVPL